MQVQLKPTDSLRGYERNSRTHSPEQIRQIAASITEFGWTNPLLVDGKGQVIAGHGRLAAAKLRGDAEVPCIVVDHLTEAQQRALVIADNKLALNSGWDEAVLAKEIEWLKASEFDVDVLGFDADFFADLLAKKESNAGLRDEDETPELPEVPTTRAGDLWICGKHRLLCGDSTSLEALQRLTAGQPVDLWLTDPPYNVAYEGKTKDAMKIQNDAMSGVDFRKFLREAYAAADSVMKAGAAFYIWFADVETNNFTGALVDVGWPLRQMLIWKKNTLVMGRKDYHFKHEPCLYGWKPGAAHLWASDRKQTTVIEIDKPTRNGVHPTMKPVALFEYQMLNNTKGGDQVLDSFGGSGTTMIAAEKNGRYARLMELGPNYCDVIVKRWQEFTGKAATLEGSGQTFDEIKEQRGKEDGTARTETDT